MQNQDFSRWLTPLMAFCVSFLIIVSCASALGIASARQFDFWLLWLVGMLIMALPLAYLEVALVKRSKTTALNALSSLTRDADASPKWRLVGWLAVIFMPFVAGAISTHAADQLLVAKAVDLPAQAVYVGFAVAALILSLLQRQWLILSSLVAVLVTVVTGLTLSESTTTWQWTAIEFKEWGQVSVLALVASGLGLGIYSQTAYQQVQTQTKATVTSLPVWVFQLLAVLAFAVVIIQGSIPAISLAVASIAGAALLLQLAREQLAQRQIAVALQWVIIVVAFALWCVLPVQDLLFKLLMLWGLITCLIYAIFAGWIMKISHLRKAMNFDSELIYNVWRIAVRVMIPVAIIAAIISLILQWLS